MESRIGTNQESGLEFASTIFHVDTHIQRVPHAWVHQRRIQAVPHMRVQMRSLLASGRLPQTGGSMERWETGGIRFA